MTLALLVSVAAALGALARYLLDRAVQRAHSSPHLPWGTFAINVTGSFALGLVTGLGLHHGVGHNPTAIAGTGFLGGYTTWSTFMWESFSLTEQGLVGAAATNVIGSLGVGLAAAAAGLGLALL